jgi:hypothetical protein
MDIRILKPVFEKKNLFWKLKFLVYLDSFLNILRFLLIRFLKMQNS